MNEHRHIQVCHPQRVTNATLIAKIRERHDDAINLMRMTSKQIGAKFGFVAAGAGKVTGKESTIAHDNPERHSPRESGAGRTYGGLRGGLLGGQFSAGVRLQLVDTHRILVEAETVRLRLARTKSGWRKTLRGSSVIGRALAMRDFAIADFDTLQFFVDRSVDAP